MKSRRACQERNCQNASGAEFICFAFEPVRFTMRCAMEMTDVGGILRVGAQKCDAERN